MSKATFLAVLSICAFSLQGCGEDAAANTAPADNTAAYQAAAAGAGNGTAATELQKAGGCPNFLAAMTAYEAKFLEELIPDITGSLLCTSTDPVLGSNFTSTKCQDLITEKLADYTVYYVEKDPGFTAWITSKSGKWKELKEGKLSTELEEVFKLPVAEMQTFASLVIEGGAIVGTAEFQTWLTAQCWQVVTATLGVFCPATPAEVSAAIAADAGNVAAQEAADDNAAAVKEAAAKNEVAGEGLDGSGASTTGGAGITTVTVSTSSISTVTNAPLATPTTTAKLDQRRLVELLQV
jgi:hypothetical protein